MRLIWWLFFIDFFWWYNLYYSVFLETSVLCTASLYLVISSFVTVNCFLQSFYSDRFGEGVVHIVKDSNPVDRESLDPTKVSPGKQRHLHLIVYG